MRWHTRLICGTGWPVAARWWVARLRVTRRVDNAADDAASAAAAAASAPVTRDEMIPIDRKYIVQLRPLSGGPRRQLVTLLHGPHRPLTAVAASLTLNEYTYYLQRIQSYAWTYTSAKLDGLRRVSE